MVVCDSNALAYGDEDGNITIVNRQTGEVVVSDTLHDGAVTSMRKHPTHPHLMFSAGEDGTILSYNLQALVLTDAVVDLDAAFHSVYPTGQPVQNFYFVGAGCTTLVAVSTVETISLWDITTCEIVAQFPQLRQQLNTMLCRFLQ
uniref:Periodic tryptophan protein 2 n=1 Tax=Lygus hesperus TaxID=30085 RepID=A0A0A9X5V4_LYGHE